MSRVRAPTAMDMGMTNLLSDPTTSLTRWGATRPTNPMIPVKATIAAVMNAMTMREIVRKRWTSIPRLVALLSPSDITFSLLAMSMTKMEPMTVTISIRGMYDQVIPSRFPICHMYADLSVSASVVTIR